MAESDKDLPKGLVNLTDVHCPITEMDAFGLPYHGLVVNGKLTLPNGKVIDYKQPASMAYTTTSYQMAPYWVGSPFNKYTNWGYILVPQKYYYSGATVLVRGKNIEAVTRSKKQLAEDKKNGYQWKNYAYLSGTFKQIGAVELSDPNYSFFGGTTAYSRGLEPSIFAFDNNKGKWLYNDGTVTWVLEWFVNPGRKADYTDPPRVLTVTLKGMFGAFGLEYTNVKPIELYRGPFATDGYSGGATHPALWMPFHSADGSKTVLNCLEGYYGQCTDTWITCSMYVFVEWNYDLQMLDDNPYTGQWYEDIARGDILSTISVTGKGSLLKDHLGEGLQVTVSFFDIFDWYYDNGYNPDASFICKTTTPEGNSVYWWIDSNGDEHGVLRNSSGLAISYSFPDYRDWPECHDGNATPTYYGVHLTHDGCFLRVYNLGNGPADFTTVHLQSPNTSCPRGISYDIVNDKWSTLENSCYV